MLCHLDVHPVHEELLVVTHSLHICFDQFSTQHLCVIPSFKSTDGLHLIRGCFQRSIDLILELFQVIDLGLANLVVAQLPLILIGGLAEGLEEAHYGLTWFLVKFKFWR